MNVLSLFDGQSCGQIALKELGITPDKYYASEIDKHAIAQTQLNFPNTIQLGSVLDVDVSKLDPIDLLIGGSPCQSFSFAGKRNGMSTTENEEIYTLDRYLQLKEEGFQFEGQSYLFWEYMRILTDIRKYNPNVKFLLENVEMGNKWERVLSEAIGIFGVHINSALVSAQNRKRIYFTNIRVKEVGLFGELHSDIPQPEDEGILLKDILEEEVDEKYFLSDAAVKRALRKEYSMPQINPDKTWTINTKNNSGQCSSDSGTTFVKVDKQLNLKNNQDKASCFTAGANSGGNHSDMDLLVCLSPKRTEYGKQISKQYEAGLVTEQRKNIQQLEPSKDGKTNTLTTVQKDNLVLAIPEATLRGYAEIKPGECFDFENPNSKTRRGRKMENKCNSLMSQNMSFMNYTENYRIRRLTPTEVSRLQTIPEWYKWESIETICQNFNSNNICQQYANQKDVINQSQVKKLACATNTILGFLEPVKQNYQDMSLIRANNVAWKVAVENNKQASMSASCTINDLKSMGLLNCLNELTSQSLNVNFVLKRLEEMVVLECAISTTKCGKFTEILYIPKKTESNQAEMDIIEILMENNFIGKLQKKLSEENLSKELKLSIILTLINLIMSQVIWSYLRKPNTHLYISSSIELQENSLELKLSNIKMDRITKTSDSSIYKLLGNGWTVKVIMHILKHLK